MAAEEIPLLVLVVAEMVPTHDPVCGPLEGPFNDSSEQEEGQPPLLLAESAAEDEADVQNLWPLAHCWAECCWWPFNKLCNFLAVGGVCLRAPGTPEITEEAVKSGTEPCGVEGHDLVLTLMLL